MAEVYILYSSSLDKYYVGSCLNTSKRIEQHLTNNFPSSFTGQAKDWMIYYSIENLAYSQARKIEKHIKRMKSKKYIQDLKRYPEIATKLISKYK